MKLMLQTPCPRKPDFAGTRTKRDVTRDRRRSSTRKQTLTESASPAPSSGTQNVVHTRTRHRQDYHFGDDVMLENNDLNAKYQNTDSSGANRNRGYSQLGMIDSEWKPRTSIYRIQTELNNVRNYINDTEEGRNSLIMGEIFQMTGSEIKVDSAAETKTTTTPSSQSSGFSAESHNVGKEFVDHENIESFVRDYFRNFPSQARAGSFQTEQLPHDHIRKIKDKYSSNASATDHNVNTNSQISQEPQALGLSGTTVLERFTIYKGVQVVLPGEETFLEGKSMLIAENFLNRVLRSKQT